MASNLELQLTLYPAPVLRRVAEPVTAFDAGLEDLVRGMFEVMQRSKGVGLAAPQVGLQKRILILNPTGEPADDLALVNVQVLERFGPESTFEEGCLSFPEIFAEVVRPESCRVRAFTPKGEPLEREFSGFQSRIIQHEYDHLEGVLLVDRMSPADKLRHRAALEALVDRYRKDHPVAAGRRR
jgi:peptide deformylase